MTAATVTIHVPHRDRAEATRQLQALADHPEGFVRAATAGVTVDARTAVAYLANGRAPVGSSRLAIPPALAAVVRGAETQAGLVEPPDTRVSPRADGTRAPRKARTTTTTTAPEE